MKFLIYYLDPSLKRLFQEVLELEGYTVMAVRTAKSALRTLEKRSDTSFVLLADNVAVSRAAREFLTVLADRPTVRCRVRVIVADVESNLDALRSIAGDDVIDDYLTLPFSGDQLLNCIETNTAKLSE